MKKDFIFIGIMASCLILAGCSGIKAKVHEMTTPDTVESQKTDQVKEGTTQTKNKKSKKENNSKDTKSKKEDIDGVTKIGKNRYEISVDSMTNPDGAFTKKAKQVCPNGHRVIERTKRGEYMVTIVGTIECE